jgi:7,8-dihydroneopterin aldolase/epimerase/oxygenase
MGMILLEGMEFYAFHGCYKEERIVGNRFQVDLTIECNTDKASESDEIEDALNYQIVYNLVKAEMTIKSHLLEHVAKRILDSLFQHFTAIQRVTVKVSKLNPAMGGKIEKVSILLERKA